MTELNKMFSGKQPRQDVKVLWRFGTDCVPTYRVVEPKPMVCFWFYQAIGNILKMGTQSVHKTSENLHILTRLSAGEHCIALRLFVLCNKNQLGALFILSFSSHYLSSVFRQSTSTCFGHICSPSSGGIVYIYSNGYVLCFSVDCLPAGPADSQLKSTTRTSCCIYTLYLLMMGYKYVRNM